MRKQQLMNVTHQSDTNITIVPLFCTMLGVRDAIVQITESTEQRSFHSFLIFFPLYIISFPYNSSYFRFSCFFIHYICMYIWLNNAKIEYRRISYSDFLRFGVLEGILFSILKLTRIFLQWSSTFYSDHSYLLPHF